MDLNKVTAKLEDMEKDVNLHGQAYTNKELNNIADMILEECEDVITEFKKLKKKWTWNPFKLYKLYKPVISEVVEVVQVVGQQLALSNAQKKTLAQIVIYKIVEPFLPKGFVGKIVKKVVKWGINKGIEKILNWLKGKIKIAGKDADSKVFKVGSVK